MLLRPGLAARVPQVVKELGIAVLQRVQPDDFRQLRLGLLELELAVLYV